MDKDLIKQAIKELHEEGCFHVGCPWDGVDPARLEALKTLEPLPHEAANMVLGTYKVLKRFTDKLSDAIAAGLFIALIAIILLGTFGIGKVVALWTK